MRTTKRTLITAALAAVAVIALVSMLSPAALGDNPAEEMAKVGTTDPKGNSWMSIQNSIEQFGHPEFILRLFLSLTLAVGCAWAIAWHPRRSSLANPLADLEERKALILLGMVGREFGFGKEPVTDAGTSFLLWSPPQTGAPHHSRCRCDCDC